MIVKKITYFKGKGVFEMSRFTLPRDIYHGKGCLEEPERKKSNPGCRRRLHEASGIPRQS